MAVRRRERETWTYSGDGAAAAFSPDDWSTRNISADDLRVVFQPIVALDAGSLFAAEALVRCRLPAFDSPERLFEAAEVEHACGRLGRVIRELAFAQAPDVPLFVNLHPQELSSRWLVRPDDPMNFHQQTVYLEVTESAAFDHFDLVMSTLKEVCSRNDARLVVDDFGAGYSNLKRVAELEPAIVKLDRELVRGLHQSQRQQALVGYVVRLCNALGARVVAEGIETPGELRAARDCGVDYGQGFLLARPGNPMPLPSFPLEPTARYSRRPSIESRMSAAPRSRRSSRPRRFPIKR